ncbi:LacI family DNA-binding transcriptional regulator [Phycicoccus sp. CSK15P-2]|uniref:LacI family DNA-binding transcriptional regulator n=1 Tax=Phycicoccus sp. CSK15P-2 TaxID=2807627 RepID=UPI0019527703|nr:LacI family DNA-binding transcriptional regulator [Phycicoccus sp. CSK15P-2]MBM6403095.1 LacI family DNA-binding transcriptional regulator [Phycicoccus sp. CSK15P-2]
MPNASPPTMAHVASRAGVSHQTVSRVLNDADAVRPETREKVLQAIADLGYRRNSAARALVTRRSGLIGVIVDELPHYGPARTVTGIAEAAREAGYGISLDPLLSVTGSTLDAAIEHHLEQSVEAIVLVTARGKVPDAATLSALDVPLVALDGQLGEGAPTAGVDQHAGGVMATRHLLDLGHTGVAHVAGPQDWPQARARLAGFRDSADRAGLAEAPVVVGDWSPASGHAAALEALDRHPDVTALFVANDQMAAGVLRALAERGLRVPEDVSVVGFDDIPEAAFLSPPLTTIRQDFASLGREAVRLVVSALGESEPEPALVPPRLVARESTARPPRATTPGT